MLREYQCESVGTVFWLHHEPVPDTGRMLRDFLLRTPGVERVIVNTLPTAGFFEVDYRGVRIVALPDDPEILTLQQPTNAEPSPLLREFAERLDEVLERTRAEG
ncbi:MAG: hypothetical protein AAFV77_03765 [Planctomycetota bacterium]